MLFSKCLPTTSYCTLICRLFVDYRHFDAKNITPRFEFGFGLSYTQFQYSGLSIAPVEDDAGQDQDGQLEANWLAAKPGPRGVGSSTALWLHRPAYTVSFTVHNAGQVAGTEVRIIFFVPNQMIYYACGPKNRYRRCTCISPMARESRPQSCADLETLSCSPASRWLSM